MAMDDDEERIIEHCFRLCDRIDQHMAAIGAADSIHQTATALWRQCVYTGASICELRRSAQHRWINDGVSLLRCLYDSMLQTVYLLHDPLKRQERATLYRDFRYIERFCATRRLDQNATPLANCVSSSAKRPLAEKELQRQVLSVGPKYLKGTQERHRLRKQGAQYLLSGARYRDHWYTGTLRDVAKETGYLDEYEILQPIISCPSVHSSPTAIFGKPPISEPYVSLLAVTFVCRATEAVVNAFAIPHNAADEQVFERFRRNIFNGDTQAVALSYSAPQASSSDSPSRSQSYAATNQPSV